MGTRRQWLRPRRDIDASRDRLETETSRPRPQPWFSSTAVLHRQAARARDFSPTVTGSDAAYARVVCASVWNVEIL